MITRVDTKLFLEIPLAIQLEPELLWFKKSQEEWVSYYISIQAAVFDLSIGSRLLASMHARLDLDLSYGH